MANAIFDLSASSNPWRFMRSYIEPYAATLLKKTTLSSLHRATILLSPYVPPRQWDESMIASWAAAVSAVPYSEMVGRSMVNTVFRLASMETLQPYIPIGVWAWLKLQLSLPPVCVGRDSGNGQALVCLIRGLGDPDILKSYLFLVWSEWNAPDDSSSAEMQASIAEDLGGVGMQHHRADLIERLDHILGELDRGLEHLEQFKPGLTSL